jgi:limonene-1,2-epoxide hydrolase
VSAGGTAEANDAVVCAFLQAWEARETDAVIDHLTDDAIYHAMPLSPIVGKQAVGAWVRSFEGKPPARLTVRHQVASERVVVNERVDDIVLNGRAVTLPICGVFEIRDGRIGAWREYFDLAPARAAYE